MVDQQLYDEGLRPHVLINWESFERRGIMPAWRAPFTSAAINAYTRWANVIGVDLRFQFFGYTTRTHAAAGELLIYMDDRHPTEPRLTSTFGSYNQLEVVFHRMNGEDLSPWNFVPFNGRPGEYDMQALLMHEFGHGLGLDHAARPGETLHTAYSYHAYRFGPFSNDIARARQIYPDFTHNRLRQMRSTDGGATWSPAPNDLTTYNHIHARTNANPGVVALPTAGLYVVGWTVVNGAPTWLRGDGSNFLMRNWQFFGAEYSMYGPALASDGERTILSAYVVNDDRGTIRVVRSRDQGFQWRRASAPEGASTYGTPGLAATRVDGQLVWILVWSNLDHENQAGTGCIHISLSIDEGVTWSPPRILESAYKALAGVAVAADMHNHVVVSFAWAPHGPRATNRIRTFTFEIRDDLLIKINQIRGDEATRSQPSLTYDEATNRFILAWREQNFQTSLSTARMAFDEARWSDRIRLDATSSTAPSVAAMPALSETVMWYASE